jgi:hypothetical protein
VQKKPRFKLNKLDREVMRIYEIDPTAYTLKELALAQYAEVEKMRRMRLEIFVRSQAREFVDFLEGRGEWNQPAAKPRAGKGKTA